MPSGKKKDPEAEVNILKVNTGLLTCCILGDSPLICNRMSEKARQELILPGGKKTAADRANNLKHDPMREFRGSPYTDTDGQGPTRIQLLASMFKKAMMNAALDLPGARKTQIGRLVYVLGDRINVYGTPQVMCSVVRSSDINHTPDIRTRAILPRWACKIQISFVTPILNATSIGNLLAAGGITSGIGDWRVEKGSGNYGRYHICDPKDPEYLSVLKEGRKQQVDALSNPTYHDDETRDLLSWFAETIESRGKTELLEVVGAAA